jgi:hypothetical protein
MFTPPDRGRWKQGVEARVYANSERLAAPLMDRSPRRVDYHPMRAFVDPFPVLGARVVR